MNAQPNSLTLPPLSLYVHIPWCIQKCPYCDFNSHKLKNDIDEQGYIDKLLQDLEHDLALVPNRQLHSIFIGGGTPSLLSPEAIERLLKGIESRIPFETQNKPIEITMEANPGTFEKEKFKGFAQAGINRLSIGIQSFNNTHLKKLGRIHDSEQAIAAAEFAHEAGFNSFNLDLMHGLPEQSIKQALTDLETAIKLKPHHISWYQLTLEPNTLFYQKPPKLPHDDLLWDIQEYGLERLNAAGYVQYETSAFSHSKALQSQHNKNYWQFGDYLGIGAGAHGKISQWSPQQHLLQSSHEPMLNIIRTTKKRHPKDYLSQPFEQLSQYQQIAHEELPFEFMLNALRLIQGVDAALFNARTGLPFEQIQPTISALQTKGFLEKSAQRIAPTEKGALFLNEILEHFMA